MNKPTDYGCMIAIYRILYGQYIYNIWDIFELGLKSNVFLWKKQQLNDGNHRKGTHSAKTGLIVWPKVHQIPQNSLCRSAQLAQ